LTLRNSTAVTSSGSIDWRTFESARTTLEEANAFAKGAAAKLKLPTE
jgi:hypothetical protein